MVAFSTRPWTLMTPSPHGTTTRVLPKHTVTFISSSGVNSREEDAASAPRKPFPDEIDPRLLGPQKKNNKKEEEKEDPDPAAGWRPPRAPTLTDLQKVPRRTERGAPDSWQLTLRVTAGTKNAQHASSAGSGSTMNALYTRYASEPRTLKVRFTKLWVKKTLTF